MRKPLRARRKRTDAKFSSPRTGCSLLSARARARATATILTVLVAASRLPKLGSNTRVAGCRLSDGRTRGAAAPCVGGDDGGGGGGESSHPPVQTHLPAPPLVVRRDWSSAQPGLPPLPSSRRSIHCQGRSPRIERFWVYCT